MNPVKVRNVEIGTGIPKICVPIVGVTREDILKAAREMKELGADVVEWRVDWYEDIFDAEKTEGTMKQLRCREIGLCRSGRCGSVYGG